MYVLFYVYCCNAALKYLPTNAFINMCLLKHSEIDITSNLTYFISTIYKLETHIGV